MVRAAIVDEPKPRVNSAADHTCCYAPRQVWWDMTHLPPPVIGRRFRLYLIRALYSLMIVGQEVHDSEHAKLLLKRTALGEGIAQIDRKPVRHGDNGAMLKPPRCWGCCIGWASSPRTRSLRRATTTHLWSRCSKLPSTGRSSRSSSGLGDPSQGPIAVPPMPPQYNISCCKVIDSKFKLRRTARHLPALHSDLAIRGSPSLIFPQCCVYASLDWLSHVYEGKIYAASCA